MSKPNYYILVPTEQVGQNTDTPISTLIAYCNGIYKLSITSEIKTDKDN